jgi:hypothetical protein
MPLLSGVLIVAKSVGGTDLRRVRTRMYLPSEAIRPPANRFPNDIVGE